MRLPPAKRLAFVLMSYDLVLAIAGPRPLCSVSSTLPIDATVAYLELIPESRQVRVYYESEANELVHEGALIPEFKPSLTEHYPAPTAVPV